VKLYTGNGSTQTISGLGFSPDLLFIKNRTQSGRSPNFTDIVRGATKTLFSDDTAAEVTDSNDVSAFTSDGFSLGSNARVNGSTDAMVAWAWDAGTSTVSNTQGSITSQVRANATAGFSIVSFNSGSSGAKTIGHGLGIAPSLIIAKNRDGSANWTVYHSAATTVSQFLMLNSTNAVGSSSNIWGSTAPTSTVFGFDSGTNQAANANIIAYCFAPVVGYSSMSSYTGNGSADGPFVYTGFRPRWVMIKRSDSANYWIIQDAARNGFNVVNLKLAANASDVENEVSTIGDTSQNTLDFLSNGFKCRTSNAGTNASSGTFVYACFAESPLQYARAR